MDIRTDNITVFTHSSIGIFGSKTVYFDPFQMNTAPHDADIVCITHSHYDHFSPEDLQKVCKPDTVLVFPESMANEVAEPEFADYPAVPMAPRERRTMDGVEVETIPAYNLHKPFHPKGNAWVGYLITMDNIRYYIAGDTDVTEENQKVQCDIALVPIGGTYTMTAKKAAGLVNTIRPKVAIPTHYGSIVGTKTDADEFRNMVSPEISVLVQI